MKKIAFIFLIVACACTQQKASNPSPEVVDVVDVVDQPVNNDITDQGAESNTVQPTNEAKLISEPSNGTSRTIKEIKKKPVTLDVLSGDIPDLNFESIELISLETLPDILIGAYNQLNLELTDSGFYIANSLNESTIFRFNSQGEFMNTIGTAGGGPQEFPSMNDICIHGDTVDVLAGMGDKAKIIGYKTDGTFLYAKTINQPALSFEWTSPGYILETNYNANYKFRTYITDESGEITGSVLANTTNFPMAISGDYYARLGSTVYRHEGYRDTVYIAEGESFYPSYRLDLGDFKVPDEYFEKSPVQAFQLIQNNAIAIVLDYFETPSYAFFNLRQNPSPKSDLEEYIDMVVAYDKNEKKLVRRTYGMESEDLFQHPVYGTSDDELVFLIYPYMISGDRDSFDQLPIINPEIIENMDDGDNPIFAFCKLE